ncbi:MAG: hypothetical protein ACXABO_06725 [Promethearchaeota archaeon]
MSQLSDYPASYISRYYRKHFIHKYPRYKLRFASYPGFNKVRNVISSFIFRRIMESDIKGDKIVLELRNKILKGFKFLNQLNHEEIEILRNFVAQYNVTFIDYFTDLVNVIKLLTALCKTYRKIGAYILVSPLAESLGEKGINLLQTKQTFSRSVGEIYDYLQEKHKNFFPFREFLSEESGEEKIKAYKKIIGNKIKLYILKNIYNGMYLENEIVRCPRCKNEKNFTLNTNILRLNALEFHHSSHKKEINFSVKNLYKIFIKNRSDPHFLENLILMMETQKVEVLCRCHHLDKHHRYYHYFIDLINWENIPKDFSSDIYSFPAVVIHMLIIASVDNHRETQNLPIERKYIIRKQIEKYLKKRYIIEQLQGKVCPGCREFNTKEHLSSFVFHHINEKTKSVNPSKIYYLPCSEIAKLLRREKGGYICHNCHTVLHYKRIHLFGEIYEDRNLVKAVNDDYNDIYKNYSLIQKVDFIKDPLRKSALVTRNIEKYVLAIDKLSKAGIYATSLALKDFLGLKSSKVVLSFFKGNKFIKLFVEIEKGRPYRFSLNDRGKEVISLLSHFRDFYSSL